MDHIVDVNKMVDLDHRYLKTFSTLRSNPSRSRWTAATKFRAPHKPLLLLAVINLIAQGIIKTNFIEFTPDWVANYLITD